METDLPDRLLNSVSTLLRVFTVDERRFPAAEGRTRYNPIEFQTLRYLGAHPDCTAAEIARYLGIVPTTQQSVLDRMAKNGIVEKLPNRCDRRAKRLRLTASGDALLAAIIRQDLSNMQTMLHYLEEDERETFVQLNEKIAFNLTGVETRGNTCSAQARSVPLNQKTAEGPR